MIKRSSFEDVGGFDEEMGHAWQDVDLCLRILNTGKLIIFTPYALLYHYEGATRGKIDTSPEEVSSRRLFEIKHHNFIQSGDPYYNPNLSLYEEPFLMRIPENLYNDPIELLLTIYASRKDLQETFPEVRDGIYERLIEWAKKDGLTNDSSKYLLEKFAHIYLSMNNVLSQNQFVSHSLTSNSSQNPPIHHN